MTSIYLAVAVAIVGVAALVSIVGISMVYLAILDALGSERP